MNNARQSIHGSPNKSGEWRIGEQRKAINSRGSRLVGGGCMNDNQFMGLRIRFEGGG